ncbi:MAG TPA: ABC transporter substrate-binding protein [Casimicrobiaceae bacterium]|nr:ABC transporter substrate-binding protein [Casimicrobiaceae bacterium]
MRRIAWLTAFPSFDVQPQYKALKSELDKLGWVDGRNAEFLELRSAEGRTDRLPALAAELVRASPDVIVVQSAPATRAAMAATTAIPLVMNGVGDPVNYGIAKSYTEPGGNVTGASYLVNESTKKTLELLKEIAPPITSVVNFINPTNEAAAPGLADLRAAAQVLRVRIDPVEVKTAADFDAAFASIVSHRSESILLWPEALVRSQRMRIGRFAAEHRLPLAIVGGPTLLDAGGLLTYGPATAQYSILVARYVDRVLRGANPAKLPIEQPTKFELGISVVSAKALGIEIPASVLARADEVIR